MPERRHPNVVAAAEIEGRQLGKGSKFGATAKNLGVATGAKGIGCSWYEVPPGKAAFPHHFHCGNEESIFVLEGEGSMRIGKDEVRVRAGDYATFPTGPEHAHQFRNTGTGPLRYLCFSTVSTPEIVGYPDSKKIGAMGASSYGEAMKGNTWVRLITRESSAIDYYDGEATD